MKPASQPRVEIDISQVCLDTATLTCPHLECLKLYLHPWCTSHFIRKGALLSSILSIPVLNFNRFTFIEPLHVILAKLIARFVGPKALILDYCNIKTGARGGGWLCQLVTGKGGR